MFSRFKELFAFNTTERNGITVLIILILLAAFAPSIFRLIRKEEPTDMRQFSAEIDAFVKAVTADSVSRKEGRFSGTERKYPSSGTEKRTLFPFNPNDLPEAEWKALGLADWKIKIIKNYESKGGKFRKKEDLKKIYGITAEDFAALEPFVKIPEDPQQLPVVAFPPKSQERKQSMLVDLNQADSVALLELKGIGPAYARRIIRYRDLLGGFYTKEQLLEIYGFDRERYKMIVASCATGDGPFRKIPINRVSLAELKKHPYLDYTKAKAIIDRRIIKGNYTSVGQLSELNEIPADLYEKLKHYISIEN